MSPSPVHGQAAGQLDGLPFEVSELVVANDVTTQRALVVMPKEPIVVDRERLARIADTTTLSQTERRLIEHVRDRAPRVMIFRAADDTGSRRWDFDPAIDSKELEQAGYTMSRALLPFHRGLSRAGTMLLIHTEWGLRECYAMRAGVRRLAAERGRVKTPTSDLDHWLLSNMLLHVALSLNHVIETLLPAHLTMISRRVDHVEELLSRIPAGDQR